MKSKLIITAVTLFASSFLFARNIDPETGCGTTNKKDVAGLVVLAGTKKPLESVNVTAYLISKKEQSAQTNSAGNYFFDQLRPGTYKVVFEKTGYKKVVKEKVVVREDENLSLDVEMAALENLLLQPSPLHFSDF